MSSPTVPLIIYTARALECRFVEINGKRIFTTITTSRRMAEVWIKRMTDLRDERYRVIVGFDIELDSTFQRIATLQFSVGAECLIYRMLSFIPRPFPDPLKRFLLDQENIVFVGVGLRGKLKVLRREAGITDNYIPYVELCHLAAYSYSASNLSRAGLVQLADVVLSLNLVRPDAIRRWTIARELSASDVYHACAGAYIALQIGLVLTRPMPRLATHSV